MGKIRNAEVLSLDTTKQKEVVKETKQLKKKIKDGTVAVKDVKKARKLTAEQQRGLLFISHLPHGFYEEELKKYFQQFGKVTNVKVCRSGKTGNSKGYGYVEFLNPEVAKIAAETMNNYLMFKKRITASFVPYEKRPKYLFVGKGNTPTRFSSKVRREKQYQANLKLDSETHLKRTTARISNLNKKLTKLQKLGVKTTYTPIDLAVIKQDSSSDDLETVPSNPEIEIPPMKPKKRVKNVKSLPEQLSSKSKTGLDQFVASPEKDPLNIKPVTTVGDLKQIKKKKNSKGIMKKSKKPEPLNTETVKKIARELIRKRGNSLLVLPVGASNKTKTSKRKTSKE